MIAKRQHKSAIVQSVGRHQAHFSFAIKDMCASAQCSELAVALREAGVQLHEMQELFMSTKPVASMLAIHLTAAVTVQAAAIIKPF